MRKVAAALMRVGFARVVVVIGGRFEVCERRMGFYGWLGGEGFIEVSVCGLKVVPASR